MTERKLTEHPHLTFGHFYAVLQQTIPAGSHRAENPNGRGSAGLVYIEQGTVRYTFGDRHLYVKAGDLLFLPRGGRYTFDIFEEDYTYIFVNFDFTEDVSVAPEVFRIRNYGVFERYFRQLLKIYDARPPEFREECMILLYSVYAAIRREGTGRYLPSAKRESVERAAEFMRESYRDPAVSVQAATAVAGMSLAHFRRLFCAVYSVCPQDYLMDLRIDNAKSLLSVSDLSVKAIAEASGFSSPYYFSRIFRIKTGTTPSEYRTRYAELYAEV